MAMGYSTLNHAILSCAYRRCVLCMICNVFFQFPPPPPPTSFLSHRGYVVSPFGQDGFAILTENRILESVDSDPRLAKVTSRKRRKDGVTVEHWKQLSNV